MNRFKELDAKRKQYGENKDCAVKATAVVLDTSYEDAHALLKENGRKDCDGTLPHITNRALRDRGIDLIEVEPPGWGSRWKDSPIKTVSRFESWAERSKTYLIRTASHILAMKNGIVHCYTEGRKHRIKEVYRIEYNYAEGLSQPANAPVITEKVITRKSRSLYRVFCPCGWQCEYRRRPKLLRTFTAKEIINRGYWGCPRCKSKNLGFIDIYNRRNNYGPVA